MDDLTQRIAALAPWFQNIDLGGGTWTAPDHFLGDYPAFKYRRFAHALPDDLAGASVLDIGCNAGFYSFEMKKRGAGRVLGIETDPRYLAQGRLAADALGFTEVEFRQCSVYDVGSLGEKFDLVIFMGVLYHLRHPLLALDLIREHVTADDGLMLFQSMQRGATEAEPLDPDYEFFAPAPFDAPGYPKLHFVERRYAGDETNWWVPNGPCAEAMLRSAGFEVVAHPEQEVYLCRATEVPFGGQAKAAYPVK